VKRRYKILLAEDFEPSRNIMSEILSALGYEYETVANGYDVIFALKDKKFDLILLDLKMPMLDGFETIEHIRRNLSFPVNAIPVIAMTGMDYSELSQTYKEEGFDGIIRKPFSLDQLDSLLKNVLETPAGKEKAKIS
jgi:two-component system sensor histidine kinase BarA